MRKGSESHQQRMRRWVGAHKRSILIVGVGILVLMCFVQLLYPRDRLLPFAQVDGLSVGGWHKKDVAWELDNRYSVQPVSIYFGDNTSARQAPLPADIGLSVQNTERVETLGYPWYMRLIPTSLFWQASLYPESTPRYNRNDTTLNSYIKTELGNSCDIKPINASLKAKDATVVIVPASNGGTCKLDEVASALRSVTPIITEKTDVHIAVKKILPDIEDNEAQSLASVVNGQLEKGVRIKAGSETVVVDTKVVASWIETKVVKDKLMLEINIKKASNYFNKQITPKVTVPAGVTKVATLDFQEISRQNGQSGRTLNATTTADAIGAYLMSQQPTISAATRPVAPKVVYTRSYSPTNAGLSALMKNYAEDHPGVFGVQMIELSGERRRAGYNETKQFVTASTYKLFVAYGTLKKVEAGTWHWSDQISGGRDMAACFDDMIVKSDNACAEALLKRYGYNELTRDIRELGLSSKSGFIDDSPKSTASDLGLLLAMLNSGQLLDKQSSRDRLLGAMKRNIYRQGIPAGAKGQVANKVGFLNKLLHDAAIVYSPSGTYVLVVMTDGSSWANISELTAKIEALRAR